MIGLSKKRLLRGLLKLANRWPTAKPRPADEDFHFSVPFALASRSSASQKIGIVAHVYFVDLLEELTRYFQHVPGPCDVLVTTDTFAKKEVIETALSHWEKGHVEVRVVPNRGRDIAPKLTVFGSEYSNYDLLFFAHTKKSESVEWGDEWRRQIFANLCGSTDGIASILQLFEDMPALGMVASVNHPNIHDQIKWEDPTLAQNLATAMGAELDFSSLIDFPAGSMFWVRPEALKPLLKLALHAGDFPAETGQTGDTLAHAIERLFFVTCELSGHYWCKVSRSDQVPTARAACGVMTALPLAEQPPLKDMVLRGKMYRDAR